jgi:hypothetical protein
MKETERQTFEPGEPFVYRKAPGTYELGVVKRDRGNGTYACYYSTGDTAAVTHVANMHKLVNAHWAPFRWSHVWGRHTTNVGDVIDLIPRAHKVLISDGNDDMLYYFEGRAEDVPDEYMELQVAGITAFDGCVDIEVL